MQSVPNPFGRLPEPASMNTPLRRLLSIALLALLPGLAIAQEEAQSIPVTRITEGAYLSPMATMVIVDDDSELDDSFGGTLALGYRKNTWAVEIAPSYVDLDGVKLGSLAINGLLFPLGALPNAYVTVGLSGSNWDDYETPTDEIDFSTTNADAGLGYIFPMSMGSYDFGVRAEARYRALRRESDYNDADVDFDAPKHFKHALINVGLHFPLGLRPVAPAPPPPLDVVAPVAICSDGQDNDGDGQIDFPSDPGCAAPDDGDETDPAQCADGKDNDGDGLADHPADPGCSGADDNDETDPCKTPAPGERISLKGCGLGDVIVLRGVNFEFDKSRLTANAKTILDNVAEELTAYPEITVELSGHTDAKGSDAYNQSLSERRVASVKQYLVGKGIAAERMTTVGEGETKPVADNETDEGRELNRRVELKITSGVAPGGPTEAAAPAAAEAPAADAPAAAGTETAP
jgi:outer membrane protein OmpA-like peptidoglycan-associated protein